MVKRESKIRPQGGTAKTVDLGTGNDTLNVTETMTANHAYDAGDGTDVLALAAGINAALGDVRTDSADELVCGGKVQRLLHMQLSSSH